VVQQIPTGIEPKELTIMLFMVIMIIIIKNSQLSQIIKDTVELSRTS